MRILIVDDNDGDRAIYRRFLERSFPASLHIVDVETAEKATEALACEEFDCMLVDYRLPASSGLDLVERIHQESPDSPMAMMVLSGAGSEEVAVEAIKRGAQDYIAKGRLTQDALFRSVSNAVERKQLMCELEQRRRALDAARLEQLEHRDQFMSHVSHELKTPLTAIYQLVEATLLCGPEELGDEPRELLQTAFRNAEQLKRLIGDLVEATRAEAGKIRIAPGVVDLRHSIDAAVRGFRVRAASRRVRIERDCPDDLPPVLADPSRVEQILDNVLDNALKFTPRESRLEIRAGLDPERPSSVRVSVSDEGPGIDPEARERIFERAHQEKSNLSRSRQGLGLGLYICRELVTRLGGRIWVESRVGSGSTFHFTLPVCDADSILRLIRRKDDPHLSILNVDLFPREEASAPDQRPWRRRARMRVGMLPLVQERQAVLLSIGLPDRERLIAVLGADADEAQALRNEALRSVETERTLAAATVARAEVSTHRVPESGDEDGADGAEREAFARRFESVAEPTRV